MVHNIKDDLHVSGDTETALKVTSSSLDVSALFESQGSNEVYLRFKNKTTTEDDNKSWMIGMDDDENFKIAYGSQTRLSWWGIPPGGGPAVPIDSPEILPINSILAIERSGKVELFGSLPFPLVAPPPVPVPTIGLYPDSGTIELGGRSIGGKLSINNSKGNKTTIDLDGESARAVLKNKDDYVTIDLKGDDGGISLCNKAGQTTIELDGKYGVATLGSKGEDGELWLKNRAGQTTIELGGDEGIKLCNKVGDDTFKVDGNEGNIFVWQKIVHQREIMKFDASNAALYIGNRWNPGNLFIRDWSGRKVFQFDGYRGDLYVGAQGTSGKIFVLDSTGKERIRLDGNFGEISLQNADCAEEFSVKDIGAIEPGTVMVLGEEESLRPSTEAYDKKVAGVVSGAGDLKPGLILGKQSESTNRMPIALMGKVYCKVDAQYAPIEVGDLLTTSPTPGHAMKATDFTKAFGTVIGKALRSLDAGIGLIPILVTLQ